MCKQNDTNVLSIKILNLLIRKAVGERLTVCKQRDFHCQFLAV